MISDDNRREFLLGIVNGDDRQGAFQSKRLDDDDASTLPMLRHSEFMRRCADYFPFHREERRSAEERHYRYARRWWKTIRTTEREEPRSRFGLHIAICRQKLRLIWEIAESGDKTRAKRKIQQAIVELLQLARDVRWGTKTDPYVRVSALLKWLHDRVGSLKICENLECTSGRTFFFRAYPNDRYCTPRCLREAKQLRADQRDRENKTPARTYKRSDLSRERMAMSANRRWERERAETGRGKGEKKSDVVQTQKGLKRRHERSKAERPK